MATSNVVKASVAVVLLAGAGFGFYRYLRNDSGYSEKEFFYDLSEKKLFAAPRASVPPIRGLNDSQEDAVRAVVISTKGDSDHPTDRKIAYLEKYSPELRKSVEEVRLGKAEPLSTKLRNSYRFVKRVDEEEWHAVNSPAGQKIINDWNVVGPDGKQPRVCTP